MIAEFGTSHQLFKSSKHCLSFGIIKESSLFDTSLIFRYARWFLFLKLENHLSEALKFFKLISFAIIVSCSIKLNLETCNLLLLVWPNHWGIRFFKFRKMSIQIWLDFLAFSFLLFQFFDIFDPIADSWMSDSR